MIVMIVMILLLLAGDQTSAQADLHPNCSRAAWGSQHSSGTLIELNVIAYENNR